MHIPDEQLDLFAQRLSAIGVGRRDFLKVVGAMAAFGGLGFATRGPGGHADQARARREARQGAGVPLRGRRVFPERSREPRLQQGPVLLGCARALRRAHGLQFRLRRGAVDGLQGGGQQGRLRLDVHYPEGQPLVGQLAGVGARLRVVVEAAARPRQRRALRLVPLRHQERRGLQQEEDHRPEGGRGPRQGRLDARGDARGAAGLLPRARRLPRRPAGLQAGGGEVRRQVDGGREHRQQRAVHARGVGAQQADRAQEEPALLRRQGRAPEPRDHPDHPGGHRGLALREQRARPDAPAGRRPQAAAVRPADAEGRLPLSVPRDLVPPASGDEAALRQPEGPPGGLAGHRPRERRQGEPGPGHSRLVHDPARLPGRGRRPQDQGHPEVRQEGRPRSSQGHALRGRQELAEDHADHAGRGARRQAARRGRAGGARSTTST